MNRLRVLELEKTFKINLMEDEERLFRFEDTFTIIINNSENSVLIYSLTDMLIIVQRLENGGDRLVK